MELKSKADRLAFINKQFGITEKALDKSLVNFEKLLASEYRRTLKDVNTTLKDMYAKYSVNGALSREELMKYNRFNVIEKEIKKELQRLGVVTNSVTKNTINSTLWESYDKTRWSLEQGLSVKSSMYGLNKSLIEANLLNPFDRIGWGTRQSLHITEDFNRIVQSISTGAVQGLPYRETAKLVTSSLDSNFFKAVRIIRTEQHRAAQVANNLAIEDVNAAAARLGVTISKKWSSFTDDVTRPSHLELDEQVADKDGNFYTSDGLVAQYPGGFGVAAEDINCRCSLVTDVEGLDDNQDDVEVQNYDSWKTDFDKRVK